MYDVKVFRRSYTNCNRVFDPNFIEKNQQLEEYKSLELDKLTWITLITNAVGKLYGLVGESLFYEIIQLSDNGKKCNVKIMKEDEKVFKNSFFTYKFKFNAIYGGNLDCECYLNVIKVHKIQDQS